MTVFPGPFAILAARLPRYNRSRFVPAGVLLIVLMLISSGVVAATVTHGASRLPNFDRERIMQFGEPIEQFALYRVYTPGSSLTGSSFIAGYVPDENTVYKSKFGTYQTELTAPSEINPNVQVRKNPENISKKYTYITQEDITGGTITTGFNRFMCYNYFNLPQSTIKYKVYTNGQSKLYE